MIRVRQRHGHRATPEQINVVLDIAKRSKIDESWFGEIVEARAQDGSVIYVVRDHERRAWISLRYAVKLLNEGICDPHDYVSEQEAQIFRDLLIELGIEKCKTMKSQKKKSSQRSSR